MSLLFYALLSVVLILYNTLWPLKNKLNRVPIRKVGSIKNPGELKLLHHTLYVVAAMNRQIIYYK